MSKQQHSGKNRPQPYNSTQLITGIVIGVVGSMLLFFLGAQFGPPLLDAIRTQPDGVSTPAADSQVKATSIPAKSAANSTGNVQNPDLIFPPPINRPNVKANMMGLDDAPVYVENISNFQCVHCTTFAVGDIIGTAAGKITETQIFDDYIATGKVRFKYITYSWTPDQKFAPEEGAYCAGDQGKFFDYRDLVFLNKDNARIGGLSKDNLVMFALALNLDMNAFNECFNSHKYFYKIAEDMDYAASVGMTGTPSFLVNGKLVFSNTLVSTIEAALASAGIPSSPTAPAAAITSEPTKAGGMVIQPIDKTRVFMPPADTRTLVKDDTMGSPDAKVKVEYFGNFECGICNTFATGGNASGTDGGVYETLLTKSLIPEGKVFYRYVPLPRYWDDQYDPSAEEAVYCAMDQGKFWEYRDLVFLNNGNSAIGGISPSSLTAFAEIMELDMDQFNQCFTSHEHAQKAIDNVAYAKASGPINTYYFLINGQPVMEPQLMDTINAELAK